MNNKPHFNNVPKTNLKMQQYNRCLNSQPQQQQQQLQNGQMSSERQPLGDQLAHHQQQKSDQIVTENGRHHMKCMSSAMVSTLEPCKHAASCQTNDRSPLKATTATN